MARLAIIATHPVQYYAPWFRHLAQATDLDIRVFYLWEPREQGLYHPGFGQAIRWDTPLLEGYGHEFVANASRDPGTHRFFGLSNPALRERVERYAPDAVLLTAYNFAATLRFLLAWDAKRAPLLFRGDSHRLVATDGWKEPIRRRCIAWVYRRCAAVLFVGKANREYFRLHGVPPERLFHSPHAVDNEFFAAARESADREAPDWRRELGIPANHALVLFAGKFEDKKRPQDLLDAFARARPAAASLLFVGAGPLEPALRERAKGVDHVHFAPFQNQTRMPRAYAAADLFVLPSRGPAETWGLAVNEAMCMARAVVVSDHVGCAQDLVQPHRNGLVFAAGDVGALADCLREALSDRARLKAWGEEGRRIVSACSYRESTAGLLAALASLGIAAGWRQDAR